MSATPCETPRRTPRETPEETPPPLVRRVGNRVARVEWRSPCDRVVAAASRVRVEDEADAGVGHAEEGVAQAIGGEDVGRREEEGFRDPPHGGVEAREVVMRPHGALDVELGGEEAPSALGLGVPGLEL
jgi:hypothetical protein